MQESENITFTNILPLLEKSMKELDETGVEYDGTIYELADFEDEHDWPGLIIYDKENGDISLTYKQYESDDREGFMLCLKAWSRDESSAENPEYIEWCFPLPGKELTSDYLCSVIERFNQARKEGFKSRGTKEVSSYVKETARLNGLGTLLSEIGIQAYFSSADRSFPCLWIFDGYEDDAGNENAGCLIKLSYICLEEDDSKWLLSVECSRTSDEKTYPGEPVLKEPVVRMLILEDDELQDVQRYGRILEVVESTTRQ